MARQPAPKKPTQAERYIGKRVRIRAEGEVLSHHEAGPTAPERVMVRVGGIITVVPVSLCESLSPIPQTERAA